MKSYPRLRNARSSAARPRVICLMQTSVDGKIMIDRWPDPDAAEGDFESTHELHRADAWLCGRVTMAYFARTQPKAKAPPAEPAPAGSGRDFIGPGRARSHAVAVDPRGKLDWQSNEVNGDRLIVLLSDRAPAARLAGLRKRNIPYLITGRGGRIDFRSALEKLRRHFGIRRLMLEGGGAINASFLRAGLIDELSLLLSPVIDGDSDTTGLFQNLQGFPPAKARGLRLVGVRRRRNGVLWLRYRVDNIAAAKS